MLIFLESNQLIVMKIMYQIKKTKKCLNIFLKFFKQKLRFIFLLYIKNWNLCIKNKYLLKQIYYIFNIRFIYNNIFINILTSTNKNTIMYHSFGFSKAKKVDKRTKLHYILQIIKKFITKTKTKKFITINFIGKVKYYYKFFIKFIKSYYYIQTIKFYNLISYNGCRLRKKQRK